MRTMFYYLPLFLLAQACLTGEEYTPPPVAYQTCYLLKSTTSNSANNDMEEKTYVLNAEGKIVSVTTTQTGSSPASFTENYTYNGSNRLSKIEGPDYHSTYEYNTANQVSQIKYYVDDVLTTQTDILYNSSGQLTKKTYFENVSGKMTYTGYRNYAYADFSSRNTTKESYYDVSDVLHFTIDYQYDDQSLPAADIGVDLALTQPPSVNNVAKSTYTQITGSPGTTVTTSTFTYNEASYPSKVVNQSSITNTIDYVYTCK
ncbi:MAG: hypothetical protein ACOYXT_09710 [Bacteroidota bacterium]